MAELTQESLNRVVDLAGQLTKDARHPGANPSAKQILEYRLELFEKALQALHKAVRELD